jgi:hypothetical protein
MGGRPPRDARSCRWQRPVIVASDMPGKKPLAGDWGVLKSAWARTTPQNPGSRPGNCPAVTA